MKRWIVLAGLGIAGCSGGVGGVLGDVDAGGGVEARPDVVVAVAPEAADAAKVDAGSGEDVQVVQVDAGATDTGAADVDAGADQETPDARNYIDAGVTLVDSGPSEVDAGPACCVVQWAPSMGGGSTTYCCLQSSFQTIIWRNGNWSTSAATQRTCSGGQTTASDGNYPGPCTTGSSCVVQNTSGTQLYGVCQ